MALDQPVIGGENWGGAETLQQKIRDALSAAKGGCEEEGRYITVGIRRIVQGATEGVHVRAVEPSSRGAGTPAGDEWTEAGEPIDRTSLVIEILRKARIRLLNQ